MSTTRKKPGMKPGTKLGPRAGSRSDILLNLQVGESVWLEATTGTTNMMGHVSATAHRNGLASKVTQAGFIAIHPGTREVVDLVRVTRTTP